MPLKLTDNSKTKFIRNHYNTFGLPYGLPENGGTCPGATFGGGGCLDTLDGHRRATCYMAKITQIYKATGQVLKDNLELLKGKTQTEMEVVLSSTVEEFVKKNSKKGDVFYFRLHYSGDFFSEEYAQAWASVIQRYPNVRFWVYSRSHHLAHIFINCRNLTFFFSVDPINFHEALKVFETVQHLPNFALAWLGTKAAPDNAKFRWVTCPETSGKLQNDKTNGACSKCRLCVDNYVSKVKNIQFVIH